MAETLLDTVGEKLKAKFGDGIISSEQQYDFPVFTVGIHRIYSMLKFLKEDDEMGFTFLTTMCGLHYPDHIGKELGVMYQLHNLRKNTRIRLKTFFNINEPKVPTVTTLFP